MEKYQLLLRFDGEGYSVIKYEDQTQTFMVFIPTIHRRESAILTVAALNAADN